MAVASKRIDDHIKIKQFITDAKGQKVAAVLDLRERERVNDLPENLLDLKSIDNRANESSEDYEVYSRKRIIRLHV